MDKEKIVLGSGTLYMLEYTGTVPEIETIEIADNLMGEISGGASIEYVASYYTAKGDKGEHTKTILTDEEVSLKSGIMTWCLATLKKICATARVTEANGIRTIKIGGIGNYDGKKYLILFVHDDPVDGYMKVLIVGNNQKGFTIAFAKDKETVIDAEFKALPQDSEGTLIRIIEEDLSAMDSIAVTLAKATTGKTKVSAVSPLTETENTLKYKIGATAESVTYKQVCTTGWTPLTVGTTEISATAAQVITIVEVNASNEAIKVGIVTVIDNIG